MTAEIVANPFDFANLPTELLYKIFDQYVGIRKTNCAPIKQRSSTAYKRMLPLRLLNKRLGSIVELYIGSYAPVQKCVIAEANFIEPNEIIDLQPLIRTKPCIGYKDGPLKFVGSNVLKRVMPMIDKRHVNFTLRMHKNGSQYRSKNKNRSQIICARKSCPRRVAVAISGGVDSAVSALILKKRGYDVLGIHMKKAKLVVREHAIKPTLKVFVDVLVFNFMSLILLRNTGMKKLIAGYERGETLVPDIECNRVLKFGLLHDYVRNQLDIDVVATVPRLLTARDSFKDQTFFLSTLSTTQLKRSMFPIGGMMKPDVKKMAEENGLTEFATKAESMGICFVGKKRNFAEFLEKYIPPKPGPIVEVESGMQIGEHRGVHLYTLGKRVSVDPLVYPNHDGVFVARCDAKNNILYVVSDRAIM
ncbi:TRNA-5-taurinomethyluridine 2-sulfurtransferase [Aphelenchoides besseyi]|nr:TRNA-5-taurinomethyluridine 2-sulfurtransferase [Aphelenchoides besseyi]